MTIAEATIRLRELIGNAPVAMVTTGDARGELHSRPLVLGSVEDDATLTFVVDARADWVAGLRYGDPVNVSISDEDHKLWVSIAGTGSSSDDRATIDRLWSPAAADFFPDGPDSPHLRVLLVESRSAEYWDEPSSRVQRLMTKAGSLLRRDSAVGESSSIDMG
jgi:general stress protein 26